MSESSISYVRLEQIQKTQTKQQLLESKNNNTQVRKSTTHENCTQSKLKQIRDIHQHTARKFNIFGLHVGVTFTEIVGKFISLFELLGDLIECICATV